MYTTGNIIYVRFYSLIDNRLGSTSELSIALKPFQHITPYAVSIKLLKQNPMSYCIKRFLQIKSNSYSNVTIVKRCMYFVNESDYCMLC